MEREIRIENHEKLMCMMSKDRQKIYIKKGNLLTVIYIGRDQTLHFVNRLCKNK